MEDQFASILEYAYSLNVTDIHFDLVNNKCQIEYRRFKQLIEKQFIGNGNQLVNFIKYFSKMNLSFGNTPQSGSFQYVIDKHLFHYRFSVLPSLNREVGVIRIMNTDVHFSLEECVTKEIETLLIEKANQKSGMIVFSGLTGSGKSTTMFALLHRLKQKKIYTLEDPVERYNTSLIQIQINEVNGLSFDIALKQLLRQDPEIVVIGEVRDENELRSAIRCAMTGHLLLTTIHASSAQMTYHRMIELGSSSTELDQVLSLIVHQRIEENAEKPFYSYMEIH